MLVECEKCKSKFNLDEGILKEEGSRVKCSICENVFKAYPSGQSSIEEPAPDWKVDEDLEETVALDSPPAIEEMETGPMDKGIGVDFDRAFEEAMQEDSIEAVSTEEEKRADMQEAVESDDRIEEVTGEDTEKKIAREFEEVEEIAEAATPQKKPGRSRLLPVILGIMVLVVGVAAAVFFLPPSLLPDFLSTRGSVEKQEIADIGVRRLSFNEVNGSFIQSGKTGELFIIKGMVTNDYPGSRNFILIKGSILDDTGQTIMKKLVYAGNTFTEEKIMEMPLEEINTGLKNRFGKGRMNFNIKPGDTIPFMIIFENLPENLSEFTVEAVSSSPGE